MSQAAKRPSTLTAARLKELLEYDPKTGVFRWRVCKSKKIRIGQVAGCLKPSGYIHIRVDEVLYGAHRLAWLYMTGDWPPVVCDHADRNASNNRWVNLRAATLPQNLVNSKVRSDNVSGLKRVYFDKRRNHWCARIQKDGRVIWLGRFDTAEAAHASYLKAAKRLYGVFARSA